MKEVVFTKPPYMNASERRIADMHSLLNILNVLGGELSLIKPGRRKLVERSVQLDKELQEIVQEVKEGGLHAEIIPRIRETAGAVVAFAEAALEAESLNIGKVAIKESIENLESVCSILEKRMDEFEARADDPDVWVQMEPDVFRQQFEDAFAAIARNSKGNYRIHFNLAQKEPTDYYFDLKVEARLADGQLWIPLRLIDVLRDLTANARKYTPPGGKVALAVYQDESRIRVVVEDNGCGIPEDEIEKVAEFGYRANNARQRPTFGGGFGLTKAAWLVAGWCGSLTIRSEVDAGTTIHLSVPNKDLPANPHIWTS